MAFTQVSSLDYADIKTALREYLRRNTDFTDYDFEASTLSSILDLLAYNTYYTAFNTTMAVNEAFLSSASLRDNIVKRAKELGYTPKSKTSANAYLQLKVDFSSVAAVDVNKVPKFLTLKKGNCFISSDPENAADTYQFAISEDIVSPVVNNICYLSNVDGTSNLKVSEGIYISYKFTVDTSIPNQRFIIPTASIDTGTLNVKVRESSTSALTHKYIASQNILNVTSTDLVFFVQEVDDLRYELLFGDGVIGRKLQNGEIIEVSYLVSSGKNANNLQSFVFSGEIYDENNNRQLNNITTTLVSKSEGGTEVETIEEIKLNAPKFYSSQNRAVTLDDYKTIVKQLYSSIADINVYGGETESPPQYGRVFIAIKPKYSEKLSASTKRDIREKLTKYTVASVTPVIIDPSITQVLLNSSIFYNPAYTNLSSEQVKNLVIQNLTQYRDTNNLSKFGGSIKKSKLSTVIDSSEDSITSNNTNLLLRKKLLPVLNTKAQYLLCYNNELDAKCNDETNIVSTSFQIANYPNVDVYFDNNSSGTIRIYTIDSLTSSKKILLDNAGTINFASGQVNIDLIQITAGSNVNNEIFITVTPKNPDIYAVRETYLDLSLGNSTFQIFTDIN
jgi:hypothetical protein